MGLGRKTFLDAAPLSAADMNGYLMDQSVMSFFSEASRDSSIPSPSAGMVAYIQIDDKIYCRLGGVWVELLASNNLSIGGLEFSFAAGAMIRFADSADVTLSSTDHAFQIGATVGQNLAVDTNEIQARDDGDASSITINGNGGVVAVGKSGSTTDEVRIYGVARIVDHVTTTDAANAYIDSSSGEVKRSTSSGRYKENVRTIVEHELVDALRPVWFDDKSDHKTHMGFIAEEVFEVLGPVGAPGRR